MSRFVFTLCLFSALLLAPEVQAKPLKACLKNTTGEIVIRRKCPAKKGFSRLNAELLQGIGASQVGPQGPQGVPGVQGPQGPKGDQGSTGAGFVGLEVIENLSTLNLPGGSQAGVYFAFCPEGKGRFAYECVMDFEGSQSVFVRTPGTGVVHSTSGVGAGCLFQNFSSSTAQNITLGVRLLCGNF